MNQLLPMRKNKTGKKRTVEDGEPCSNFCELHVTHPCEKCGRKMARGRYTPMPDVWDT